MRSTYLLASLFLVFSSLRAPALKVGDSAPPLNAEKWFNGDPVNPAKPDGQTTYVIEFWATWCPPCKKSIPHLNELYERYSDKGIIIVGVTTESEKVVKPFVDKLPMKYRVALASRDEMNETWMKTVEGIPHAFVVDTNGVVIWEGHPMDRLDDVLADVVAGTFDPAKYVTDEDETDLDKLQEYLIGGQFDEALNFVEMKLKDKPDLRLYQMKLGLLVQLDRPQAIKETYREIVQRFWDNADELNSVAWMAVTAPFALGDLETALKAATRAVELSERKDPAILDTLARVYYALGRLPQAIRYQEEALQRAVDKMEANDLQSTLDYYRHALKISESLDAQE